MQNNCLKTHKRHLVTAALLAVSLLLVAGCVTKPVLKMMVSSATKPIDKLFYADSCEKKIAVPYVDNGEPGQVMDIYYADKAIRKDAVLVDIHGGFYFAGRRDNNREFASVFLKEGYDVVLLEYRLNNGVRDVSDELADCAAGLDYLAVHADALGLNKNRMFLTGDSAGGHLALYMAEGAEDSSLPIRPEVFKPQGALLSCPAYDFATYGESNLFSEGARKWFIGPRYTDKEWMKSVSPRTFIGSYSGPLFVSTCTNDFIRSQSLLIKADRDSLSRPMEFVDIASKDKKVGHVHNVVKTDLPESREVNARMIAFMNSYIR